jgi:hypothetical protein
MAEATEEKVESATTDTQEAADDKVADQTAAETTTDTETQDDDGEPGGTDGTAVYARRKNREAKAARSALEAEREARIRLEEQLNAVNRQAERAAEKPVFTPEQVQAEIDAGRLSPAMAAVYLSRAETQRVLAEERARETARRPVEAAIEKINEYREVLDWANDRTHPNFLKAQHKFRELVSRGSPANEATELTALEFIAGDLATLRRKNEMRTATRAAARPAPADVGGGGDNGPRSTDVTTKVDKGLIDGWKKMGATDDQVKKYAQHHLDRMAKRRGGIGA